MLLTGGVTKGSHAIVRSHNLAPAGRIGLAVLTK